MDQKRILVIEDEKPIADILKYGFEKEGFEVVCAYTGGSGLERAEEYEPDMVLLDWMLPDIAGVDVCRMLTEQYKLPIIMLTARRGGYPKQIRPGGLRGMPGYGQQPVCEKDRLAAPDGGGRTLVFKRGSGNVHFHRKPIPSAGCAHVSDVYQRVHAHRGSGGSGD